MAALNIQGVDAGPEADLNLRLLKAENRFQRERTARLEAESIAEKGLSDLYEKQRQLELLGTVATQANQSHSVEEILRFTLEAICQHTGWGFGHVFRVNPANPDVLVSALIWFAEPGTNVRDFAEEAFARNFPKGVGLPGRVLETGKALWIADVTKDPNFPRWKAAERSRLHAGFAFPVSVSNDTVAVMEFFFRDAVEPNESMLSIMSQIGTQVGRVVERQQLEDKLVHDATHDPLTKMPNRLFFMGRLERAVAVHRLRPDSRFALLFIDLDRFKLVNDSLGHAAGDILLREISARLMAVLDEEAVKSAAVVTLARLGGDEFTVLLEEMQHELVATDLADRVQDELKRVIEIDGQEIYTSASIGIASSETAHESAADLMRDADLAMYRAKTEGRARVELFDTSLHEAAMRRLGLETDLRVALRRGDFILHYQPIVHLRSNEIVGFEALIRWRRNGGELVSPLEFIGLAEETGLIVFIGAWVMREALATLARWQGEGPENANLTMSINVSFKQFHQPDFLESVVTAITASGVHPSTVRLEITESVTIRDADKTVEILKSLRALGVRVSMDDFGTGYSSLSYLHKLPFDTLKIDRSFVMALQQKSGGREIIRTILALAQSLRMEVVAEGAETIAHVDELREMGCGYAQGYFFSRPLDERDALRLLNGRRLSLRGPARLEASRA
jgi:diguanylate cyclase (GGDEF)-like protein